MGPTLRSSAATTAVGDLALAVVAVAFLLVAEAGIPAEAGDRALDGPGYAAIVVAGGALAARRRWPLPVLVVVLAALTAYLARGYPGGPVFLTALVPLYTLGVAWKATHAYLVAAVASAWLIGVGTVADTGSGLIHIVFVGWAAAAVFLGAGVRSRRERMVALSERAAQLEASREDEARRQVAEERLRIARDLHDSVAHAMTAINVQAGTAVHVMGDRPEQAREALVLIQQQSKLVLEELGGLIGVLRQPGDSAERAPTPGLDDIESLVSATRRSGCDVRLALDVDPHHVNGPVGTAAYRIVQESLTNAVRHAGPTATTVVTVTGGGDGAVSVEVVDDGPGTSTHAPAANGGQGLVGMRERTESTGGTFRCGPRPGGGFAVQATWPARP